MADEFEFEDDDANADCPTLQLRLDELERTMMRVRFESPQLDRDEILRQLVQLMEDRNKLYDRFRAARLAGFKTNLQSLKLAGVRLQPIVAQATGRCTLVIQDPKLIPPDQPAGKHKKKQAWHHPWYEARREFLQKRRVDVEVYLADYKKKKVLSAQELAVQKRLELELQGILSELTAE
jgi:hypothetical protein